MCFSAEASFAGGIIISAIGVFTIRKARKSPQILFASIPLFFGLQQFAEGLLWFTLRSPGNEELLKISTYIFLLMALVFWPLIIPISMLFMEMLEKKKKTLRILLSAGVLLSLYYAYCLLSYDIRPKIINYHIQYDTDFPESIAMVAFLFYLTATIPPLFVSSIKKMHWFGILMTLSCLVTAVFFTQYLTSVWCFFAALISGLIYWILIDTINESKLENKIPI